MIGCALHLNELPLRNIFQYIDGTTKSPNFFSGPIGQILQKEFSDQPQANFVPISSTITSMQMTDDAWNNLSSNQQLLWMYANGVTQGKVAE